jgi:arginase
MGCGPGHILESGVFGRLAALGHEVKVHAVDPTTQFRAEVATSFSIMAGIADEVRAARAESQFPLVLAGNCNTSVGTVSGLSPDKAGVVWFDGHADLATPQTTTTGFVDGMGLAILTGRCWEQLTQTIPGFTAIDSKHVILAGSSDIEPHEWDVLKTSDIAYLSDQILQGPHGERQLREALDRLKGDVKGVHLHVDLDVHDPNIARANHFRPPGGLSPTRLREMVSLVVGHVPVLAASITAYDPEVDRDGATLRSCMDIIETIVVHNRAHG